MSLWQKLVPLCDNRLLVCAVAGVSLLFVCCGGNGLWQLSKPKPEPAWMTVQKLEAVEIVAKLPKAESLELREGYLFWAGAIERISFQTGMLGRKVKGSERVTDVWVPLLSKAAFDRWQAILADGKPVGSLPYGECRVVVEFRPWQLDAQFPAEVAALRDGRTFGPEIEVKRSLYGSVRRLRVEERSVVEGMTVSGYDASLTLILSPQQFRDDTEINRILAGCIGVAGLVGLMPFGIWAVRRWRNPKGEKRLPLPTETSRDTV